MSSLATNITEPRPATADVRSDAPLRLELMSASERVSATRIWRELEDRLSNVRVTCSSDWMETWLRHYGTRVPHRFAVARRDGVAVGIALLTSGVDQRTGPFGVRTWHVGTSGERDCDSVCVEYNTLLVCHEDRLAFALALWDWAARQSGNDEFRLDGFSAEEVAPLLSRHPAATVLRKPSCYFDLKSAREDGIDPILRLSQNTRSQVRRSLRRLVEPRGEWVEDVADAEPTLMTMIELHQARWTARGEVGSYASQTFREFHLDLLHQLIPSNRMKLFRVTANGRVVGISQLLIDDNRTLVYQGGWANVEGSVSVGLVTDYLCLVESLHRGYDAFDFLAGDSTHKQRLTTDANDLVWAAWRRPRMKYAVLDTLRTVKRLLNRLESSCFAPPCSKQNETSSADIDKH